MKLPGGGDCGGITAADSAPCDRKSSPVTISVWTTWITAKPWNAGVTIAGGACGVTTQQLALDSHGMLICMQQLCVGCCAGRTHAPLNSSNTLIRAIATAARRVTSRNIVKA